VRLLIPEKELPKKEKPGTIRVVKLRTGMKFTAYGKVYEIVKIKGKTLFCKYKGECHAA